jgi:hypothetical protein
VAPDSESEKASEYFAKRAVEKMTSEQRVGLRAQQGRVGVEGDWMDYLNKYR